MRPSPTLDVVGIGNALVDVLAHDDDAFLHAHGMTKGTMALVDAEAAERIYEAMGPAVEASGGSAANTVAGVAGLGGRAAFIGRVRDDQLGAVYAHDLRSAGVQFRVPPAPDGAPTGRCLIVVTPDAQRTMNTYLGASVHFGPDDVDRDAIERATVLYLEGYLFDEPAAQEAFRVAADHAHRCGRVVSLTLSDSFCVQRHREAFVDLVRHHVDLLFANEAEILELFGVSDFDAAVDAVRSHESVAALTRSEKGSVIVAEHEVIEVPAHPVDEVVDTTGAGDLYAAGFLHGYSRGMDLRTCGRLGSLAAAEVISHVGARPEADLAALAAPILARADR